MESHKGFWSWAVAASVLLVCGTGNVQAQNTLNITDSSGNYAGTLYVGGAGIDFSAGIQCPVNYNSFPVPGYLSDM